MRNVSDKRCRENQNTHLMFNNFSPKTVPFMKLKNIVQPERPRMITIWCMHFICCIT